MIEEVLLGLVAFDDADFLPTRGREGGCVISAVWMRNSSVRGGLDDPAANEGIHGGSVVLTGEAAACHTWFGGNGNKTL
jgi:hypothetical protein